MICIANTRQQNCFSPSTHLAAGEEALLDVVREEEEEWYGTYGR